MNAAAGQSGSYLFREAPAYVGVAYRHTAASPTISGVIKVVYLAAGSAGMICGSCLHDNRVVAVMRARGRNVSLAPLYTPIRTDETDISSRRVYFGGIGVYLREKLSWLRIPQVVDRMLSAPALLRWLSRMSSATRAQELGALTVSVLKGEHGPQRTAVDQLADVLATDRPDVVHLPNLMLLGMAGPIHRATGARIVCTLGGEDIFLDDLPEPHRAEAFRLIRDKVHEVDLYVSLTDYYAAHSAAHFHLPRERIVVVPPGIDVARLTPGAAEPSGPFTIGYLARICPAKGLHVLTEAFAALRRAGVDARLRVAGYLSTADRAYFESIRQRLRVAGVEAHADFVGELDFNGKVEFLRSLHAFSVPAVYAEAKGLSVLEAMSCGVPVVQPRHGSFPDLVGEDVGPCRVAAGPDMPAGGLLSAPGDDAALVHALRRLYDDAELRRRLGRQARQRVVMRHGQEQMAERMWETYERLIVAHRQPHV